MTLFENLLDCVEAVIGEAGKKHLNTDAYEVPAFLLNELCGHYKAVTGRTLTIGAARDPNMSFQHCQCPVPNVASNWKDPAWKYCTICGHDLVIEAASEGQS